MTRETTRTLLSASRNVKLYESNGGFPCPLLLRWLALILFNLDHFDYVAKLVGVEHLGMGSDTDYLGYDAMPQEEFRKQFCSGGKENESIREKIDVDGLNLAKTPFEIAEGLIRRKYSDANIEAILGGNFRRALKEIWTV